MFEKILAIAGPFIQTAFSGAIVAAFGVFIWLAAREPTVPEDESLPLYLQRVYAGRRSHLIPRWVAWTAIAAPLVLFGGAWLFGLQDPLLKP